VRKDEMRELHCACGHRLVAGDDEGLVQQVLDHAHEAHPEMNLTEGQAREMVAAEAFDASH
jgi:predicted small metal-binding protein